MRPLTCLIAAGMLAASALPASAGTVAYGQAFDTLYRIDLDEHRATPVGAAGRVAGQTLGNISGLTTAGDGTLYAVAGASKLLLSIDPGSGAATPLGRLDLSDGTGQFNALDLNMTEGCDNTLWLSSAVTRELWTVDRHTAAVSLIGSTVHPISGLAARNGVLYGAGSKGDDGFYRIDTRTGAAERVGAYGPALTRWVNSVSMGFDEDGTLWAVFNYMPPENDSKPPVDWSDLATIDPATGKVTIQGPLVGPESLREIGMKGFTAGPPQCTGHGASAAVAAPVGSPWALALLVLLLIMGAAWHTTARQAVDRR